MDSKRPVAADSAGFADARQVTFPSASFDAVVLHLIVAVMPQPELGLRETAHVLRPGGRLAIFDKLLRDRKEPSAA